MRLSTRLHTKILLNDASALVSSPNLTVTADYARDSGPWQNEAVGVLLMAKPAEPPASQLMDGAANGSPMPSRVSGMGARPLPEYLSRMVRRSPPSGAPVVEGSTPVVAFGDPARAEVATLGINPSKNEFVGDGGLLTGSDRRLSTLHSLGARDLARLSERQVMTVVEECATYFERRPYRRWFDPLDRLLRVGAEVSYYDGSACHLDLVQWATDPIWRQIPNREVRQELLDDGVPHLLEQLANENVRLVIMNGRQVLDQARRVGLADLAEVAQLPLGRVTCRLFAGEGRGVRWIGWSTNLQSNWGVSADFKRSLGAWLASTVSEARTAMSDGGDP